MSNFGVYFGACGWRHPDWQDTFYPKDLPEDWELAFYNTQFRCVCLPYEMWHEASDEAVAAWLSDTQDGFRFVLQEPGTVDEEARRLARRFGTRGVLENEAELVWLEGVPNLRELTQRVQEAIQRGMVLYLISRDHNLENLRQVNELMDILGI